MITQQMDLKRMVRKTSRMFKNIDITVCWILWCTLNVTVLFLSVFVLPDCLFLSPSLWWILPHLFTCLCLLSFLLPYPCLFFHPFSAFPVPVSLSVFLDYLSLFSGDPSLTRSPWSSRAQWRESWIWWTTCPALSATTTRCPPGLASTAPRRRSIIAKMMTHSLHFMCRAAQVIKENEKGLLYSPCFKIWLLKNPETLQTIFFSFMQARKRIRFF